MDLMLLRHRIIMAAGGLVKRVASAVSGVVSFVTNVAMPTKVTCEFSPAQSGTGDPSPSNVRSISGWTGCEITHQNRNWLNLADQSFTRYKEITLVTPIPPSTFTISAIVTSADADKTESNMTLVFDNGRTDSLNFSRGSTQYFHRTTQDTIVKIRLYASTTLGLSADDACTWSNLQLTLGESELPYQAQVKETLTINWQNLFDNRALNTAFDTNIDSQTNLDAAIADGQMLFRGLAFDSSGITSYTSSNQYWVIFPVEAGKTYVTNKFFKSGYLVNSSFVPTTTLQNKNNESGQASAEGYGWTTFTAQTGDAYAALYIFNAAQGVSVQNWTLNDLLNGFMIIYGSEHPEYYTPYNLTVYGGTVTLNEDGSADLVVTWFYGVPNFDNCNKAVSEESGFLTTWNYFGDHSLSNIPQPYGANVASQYSNALSDKVKFYMSYATADSDGVDVVYHFWGNWMSYGVKKELLSSQDLSGLTSYLKTLNAVMCYPIDESDYQTYHFSNIGELQSFVGQNAIWHDMNGSITVEYYKNT